MERSRIARIEWAPLLGERPRLAGCNAYAGQHGLNVRVQIARLTLDDGASGFGLARLDEETARRLVGSRLDEAFDPARGVAEAFWRVELPLWDLAGRRAGQPVYRLTAAITGVPAPAEPVRVRCYDTTLYFDELHLTDDDEAAALMADEARQGYDRGHRAFKIKVGRGNLHMGTEAGLRRDVAVVHAIRAAVGPDCTLMADANNGYTLNIARDFLRATAEAKLFWLEEAFYEDAILYRHLRDWRDSEGLQTRIADGENRATVDASIAGGTPPVLPATPAPPSPLLLDLAREGLIEVVQYDIVIPGISRWLEVGPRLAEWGRLAAPHNYGNQFGNYASAHLGPALPTFAFVEWDEAQTPGLTAPGYRIADGWVHVPSNPGFGLELDADVFERQVREHGFVVTAR